MYDECTRSGFGGQGNVCYRNKTRNKTPIKEKLYFSQGDEDGVSADHSVDNDLNTHLHTNTHSHEHDIA